MHELVQGTLKGQKRSAAKLISIIENDEPLKKELLSSLFVHTGKAYLIGITGSPGAGKSSLVDSLSTIIRQQGLTLGIIAVDPSSPFSGGAILGDRIRMQEHTLDPGVFIRSMGTRGCLGGLARTTKEVIRVLDAFGCDVILVETVGVGQSELDIMGVADTTVVVLNPGAGDHIQTIKAGIMEIADIFVINKADLPGTDKLLSEVEGMLNLGDHSPWRPPVLKTSTIAISNNGIKDLWEKIQEHGNYLRRSGSLSQEREKRLQLEVMEYIEYELKERIRRNVIDTPAMKNFTDQINKRLLTTHEAAEQIISMGLNG